MYRNHRTGGQPCWPGHEGWPAGTNSAHCTTAAAAAVPRMHAAVKPCLGCISAWLSVTVLHTCRGAGTQKNSLGGLAMGTEQQGLPWVPGALPIPEKVCLLEPQASNFSHI